MLVAEAGAPREPANSQADCGQSHTLLCQCCRKDTVSRQKRGQARNRGDGPLSHIGDFVLSLQGFVSLTGRPEKRGGRHSAKHGCAALCRRNRQILRMTGGESSYRPSDRRSRRGGATLEAAFGPVPDRPTRGIIMRHSKISLQSASLPALAAALLVAGFVPTAASAQDSIANE